MFLTLVCVKPHPGFHSWKKFCHISSNYLTSCSRDILVPPCPEKLCLFSGYVLPNCVGTHDSSWPSSSSMGYSREEYWSGLPFPYPGDLTDPGMENGSLASHAMASSFFTTEPDGKPRLSVVSAVKNLVTLLSRQRQQQKIFVFPNDKLFQFTGIYIIKNCILKPESL